MALGLVLMILILTSQSEWKQQLKNEIESSGSFHKKQQQISNKHELIKEQVETLLQLTAWIKQFAYSLVKLQVGFHLKAYSSPWLPLFLMQCKFWSIARLKILTLLRWTHVYACNHLWIWYGKIKLRCLIFHVVHCWNLKYRRKIVISYCSLECRDSSKI